MADDPAVPHTPTNSAKLSNKQILYSTPKLSSCFVKEYIGLKDDDTVKDPAKFKLRHGVWQDWAPDMYQRFIEYLQMHTNLAPFARQEGVPVEEVQEVFNQSLIEDLQAIAKVACDRMNARVRRNMQLMLDKGEKARTWGTEGVRAMLYRVRPGCVELYNAKREEIVLGPAELTEEDLKYLRELLLPDEWARLHADVDDLKKTLGVQIDGEVAGPL